LIARDKRIAVVGPFSYFENHFPENWRRDDNILCLDVNEGDYSWLLHLHNFKPYVTLFYRPELYPERYLSTLRTYKIAFLSEPLPSVVDGRLNLSDETALRMQLYRNLPWNAYDWRIYYDEGKRNTADYLGFRIDEYYPLPIDTSCFNPNGRPDRSSFDVCFIGKATAHRIAKLDFLRSTKLTFGWIAHGFSGRRLAALFRRSKIVLNVHADTDPAFEPRIYLAAACGALVVTEKLSARPRFFTHRIVEENRPWNESLLREYLEANAAPALLPRFERDLSALSVRKLIERLSDMRNVDDRPSECADGGRSMTDVADRKVSYSVVVASNDDERFNSFRVRLLQALGAGTNIIRISDARSMAEAYNRAAAASNDEWLIFCHDDVFVLNDDANNVLARAMRESDVFGCCGTTRLVSGNWYDAGTPFTVGSVVARDTRNNGEYQLQVFGIRPQRVVPGIAALDGILIACKRGVWRALGGFDEVKFGGFHGYDVDFSFRANLSGFRVAVASDLLLTHESRVDDFSRQKFAEWQEAQRTIEKTFASNLATERGTRGHKEVPLGKAGQNGVAILAAIRRAALLESTDY